MAVATNDQVGRFSRSIQFCSEGQVSINRNSISVSAIAVPQVAENDDHICAIAFIAS